MTNIPTKSLKNFLIKNKKNLLVFFLLTIIVTGLQYVLLRPQLNYGFTPDDWWPLAHFKLMGLLLVWKEQGIYTTYQTLYISFLHQFLGFNFQMYQVINQILKGLAALMVYPLVLIVFKNRLLAFITVVLYAMAYSPVGTLELVVRGSDFIAVIFMCIFLITYYLFHIGVIRGGKWLFFQMILLLMSMLFSPIRIYPLLAFILFIEIYLVIIRRSKEVSWETSKKLTILFFPYLVLTLVSPSSVISFTLNAPAIIDKILRGNWQLLLYPLGSLGSIFLLTDYGKFFGTPQLKNIFDYIGYLLTNTLPIFGIVTLFYVFILSVPKKRLYNFFFGILSTNIFFQLIAFVLVKHQETLQSTLQVHYDYIELYPVFIAIYILSLSFFIWREWNDSGKNNHLYQALWVGCLFSSNFIFFTWMFKDWSVLFKGVHTYLNIPSIGSSIFIAGTLVLLYKKISVFGVLGKNIALLTFLLLIPIYNMDKRIIQSNWDITSYSMDAKEHEMMRDRVWSKLGGFDNSTPTLFYFDTSDDYLNGRFYEMSTLGRFSDWMFFKGSYKPGSCSLPVFIINRPEQLKEIFMTKKGEKGFYLYDYCYKPHFYSLKDFYAFRLKNKEPIDIKDRILRELEADE